MKTGIMLVLVLAVVLSAGAASAANLIGNSGFEVHPSQWWLWWPQAPWDVFSVIEDDWTGEMVYHYRTAAQGPQGLPSANGWVMCDWIDYNWAPGPTENRYEYNSTPYVDYSQGYDNPIYTGYRWAKKNPAASSASFYSGTSQVVTGLTPGAVYEVSAWGQSSALDDACAADMRILVDPTGGTDARVAPISSQRVPNRPNGLYWIWGSTGNRLGDWDATRANDVTGFYQVYDNITLQFTATSSTATIFLLMDWRNFDAGNNNGTSIGFDNVSMQMVPEPSGLVALVSPLLILGGTLLRRRRS